MMNKYDVHLHCMKVAKSCENFEHVKIARQILHRAVRMLGAKFTYNDSDFFFDVLVVLKGKERLFAEQQKEGEVITFKPIPGPPTPPLPR